MSDGRSHPSQTSGPLDRLLFAHPRGLGESYRQHAATAARFGGRMIAGGVKCLVHAVVPALYPRTASDCIASLNDELTRRRNAAPDAAPDYII